VLKTGQIFERDKSDNRFLASRPQTASVNPHWSTRLAHYIGTTARVCPKYFQHFTTSVKPLFGRMF